MITEKDLKTLSSYQTRSGKITSWAIVIAPIFFLIVAFFNLYAASKIGSYEGFNLTQLFKSWIEGIDVRVQYSGIYLKAMERLTTALLQIGFALILSLFAYSYNKRKKMDERILEALKNSEEIKI
jgi:hypothetical protein